MIFTTRFRAYASSRLSVERDAEGRVWTQLFPLGTWHRSDFPGGKVELTPEFLGQFITSWKAGGSPPLPLDYDHKEDGPASGWIEDLRQSPSGELEGAVKWTDDAAAEIKADKRRYLSPTWSMQHTNRRTGEKGGPWLYGAALLNDPFYDSMPRVAASTGEAERGVDAARKWLKAAIVLHEKHMSGRAPTTGPEGEKSQQQMMDQMMSALAALDSMPPVAASTTPTDPNPQHRSNIMNEEQLKVLRANLGLADNVSVEGILEATAAKSTESTEKLTAAVKQAGDLETKLTAANAEITTLKAAADASAKDRFAEQVAAAIKEAKNEGRAVDTLVATKMFKAASTIEDVRELLATVSKDVPLVTKGDPVKGGALTAADARKTYDAAVDAKVKAGAKYVDAAAITAKEMPEVSALLFGTPGNRSTSTSST